MSTYKALVGKKIKSVSSDPSDSVDGQMWYNTTTGSLRGLAISEAWTSAPNIGTARYSAAAFGSQTAGVISMGTIYPGTSTNVTEHYNGTGWSSAANYPASGTGGGGAGTQTAGLIAGGQAPRANEAYEYDGTSWSETGDLPVAADNISFCGEGTQTNIIGAIGRTPSTGNSGTNTSVTYNGSTFSSGPNLNTARMYGNQAGSGTGTAGLIWGGFIDPSPNAMTNTEEYDGSSWSNGGNLNVASGFPNGWGTQTNTVTQVQSPNYAGSERYDGTSWTALPDIGVTTPGGLYGAAAGSTGDAGWITSLSPTRNNTVEFTKSTNVITAAAFAAGGNLNSARKSMYGGTVGTQTAGLAFGGNPGPGTNSALNEEYDGTSWTESGDLNTARTYFAGFGIQTAAVGCGGYVFGGGGNTNVTEEYDGSSWSNGNNINTTRRALAGCGSLTAGLIFGGYVGPPHSTATEEYDGTNWTNSGYGLNTATELHGGAGTQTAGLSFNGDGGGPNPTQTEEYNGTSWTVGGANLKQGEGVASAGSQTAALSFAGANPPATNTAIVTGYDGTSWSTRPNMSTARWELSGGGTQTAGLAFGGASPSVTAATEEFTGETSTANVETFSTS